jgi:hypothetical protein
MGNMDSEKKWIRKYGFRIKIWEGLVKCWVLYCGINEEWIFDD